MHLNFFLDIFRNFLQFGFSSTIFFPYLHRTYPFLSEVFTLYPLKTLENLRFPGVFREYKMGTLARKGFIKKIKIKLMFKIFNQANQPRLYRCIHLFNHHVLKATIFITLS